MNRFHFIFCPLMQGSGSLCRDQRRENETGTRFRALQSPELKQRETDFLLCSALPAVRGSSHRWAGPAAGVSLDHRAPGDAARGETPGAGRCDAGVRSPGPGIGQRLGERFRVLSDV